jgi:hypothetical protein
MSIELDEANEAVENKVRAWRDPFFRAISESGHSNPHPAGSYSLDIDNPTGFWRIVAGETTEVTDDGGADDPSGPNTNTPPWCGPTDPPSTCDCPPTQLPPSVIGC